MDDKLPIPNSEKAPSSTQIESALPDDARAIMTIKRDGWLNTYVDEEYGITYDDIQKKFTDKIFEEGVKNWQNGLSGEPSHKDRATFVARQDGVVIGFTSSHTEDGKRRVGALYVAQDKQGVGVGTQLLKRALGWHGTDEDIYLNVFTYNDNAINFYENFGFLKTGKETAEQFDKKQGIKLLPEIEMVLPASEQSCTV